MKAGIRKGVHPPYNKHITQNIPIKDAPLPDEVIILLQQHTGAACQPLVNVGDKVKTGQKIGDADAFITAPVHATITGTVKEIKYFPHPVLGRGLGIKIVRDEDEEELLLMEPIRDYKNAPIEKLRERVREAGIVGLGGAAFPTHVKLAPPEGKKIDTLIINGAECEPYLTADHRIMVEQAADIIEGVRIIKRILGVENVYMGIEDNKWDAIEIMRDAGQDEVNVVELRTSYPQGGEKQLIFAILGREVPSGGLPLDVGVVVQNVGTCLAVKEAVLEGKSLIERVITVTGDGVSEPGNYKVRIGTSFGFLLDMCGAEIEGKVIMGGPMMGFAQADMSVPVVKGTSGIVVLKDGFSWQKQERDCIRCGFCVEHCPMNLMPTELARLSKNFYFEQAEQIGLMDCIECGCCAYVCPAKIPIVHYIKHAKAEIRKMKQ